MKSIKHLLLILLLLFAFQSAFSQSEGNSVKTISSGKLSPIIYIGGGAFILKTHHETAKNSISNVRMVVSTPIISVHKWNFGVNVEGDYLFNRSTNPTVTPVETPDASNSDITYSNLGNNGGFSIGGGPFLMLPIFDKLIFNPSFELLYTNIKQANQTVVQHYTYVDNATDFALYSGTSKPASGLSMMPKLNLTYQFGRIGVWLEGNYLMGPKMSSTISTLEGASIDAKGRVISEGEPVTTTSETKLNGFGINAGISLNVGSGRTRGRTTLNTDKIDSTYTNPPPLPEPSQAQDFNTTRNNIRDEFSTDNPVTDDSTNSTNSANELKKKDGMPNRISMNAIIAEKNTKKPKQSKTFGESVASGLQSGANAIGGAVSSSSAEGLQIINDNDSTHTNSNPPTPSQAQDFNTTRSNRENRFATNNNDSSYTNPNPPIPSQAQDFNTTRNNIRDDFSTDNPVTSDSTSSTNSANELKEKDSMPSRLSMTQTTTRQSQGKTFGEKVASGLQSGAASLNIVSPAYGSVYKTSDKIKIQINSTEKLSRKISIEIHKVSNDVNFWRNNSNLKNKSVLNPITIEVEKNGNSFTSELKKGKLSEGAYQMIVVGSDGIIISDFTVTD